MNIPQAPHITTDKHQVLIVDDHPVVRQGLAQILNEEPDIKVCGGAASIEEGIRLTRELSPDLVVADLSFSEGSGIDLILQIKALDPEIKVFVWSTFAESLFAERAFRAGAMGYLSKQEPVETLVTAIREVLRGKIYASPQMTNRFLRQLAVGQSLNVDPVESLSDRELQVFQGIGRGKTSKQIARELGLKPKTVDTHREKIKRKLRIKNVAQLNCCAVQWMMENG